MLLRLVIGLKNLSQMLSQARRHPFYVFPRLNWHRLYVFPRLAPVASFLPALGISRMFSRAWHWSHVFPRLSSVAYCLAFGAYFKYNSLKCQRLRLLWRTCHMSQRRLRLIQCISVQCMFILRHEISMFPFVSSKILRCFLSLLRKFSDIWLVRNFVSSKFRQPFRIFD